MFDISGTGQPLKMAWTGRSSGNAFLALDRNHNGKIDNGKELFGNFTEQPPCEDGTRACLNGYRTLAEFDKPENGGNGDGIIDNRDAVYSKLLLWIDSNHDGVSQPEELHSLPELGVYSIGLHYRDDLRFRDQYGNRFRYQAGLNPDLRDGTSKDGRLTYDVFFVTAGRQSDFNADGLGFGLSLGNAYSPSIDSLASLNAGSPSVPVALQPTNLRGETSTIIAGDARAQGSQRLLPTTNSGPMANGPSQKLQGLGGAPVPTPMSSAPVSSSVKAPKMKISNPLEAEGLKVIAFDSPEFRPALEAMIDADLIAKAEPFLQYSVILVNTTERYIWGFTAIYAYPDKIAPSGNPWRHQINPSPGGVGTRAQYLAPGAKYLLTPVSDFVAEVEASGLRRLQPSWYDGIEQVIQSQTGMEDPLRKRAELSIDSLIYEDGTLVGPDQADRTGEINRRIAQQKRFADSFAGLKSEAFKAKLAEYSSGTGGQADHRANAWLAKAFELRYNDPSLGEDYVRTVIEKMGTAQWFLGSQKVTKKEGGEK